MTSWQWPSPPHAQPWQCCDPVTCGRPPATCDSPPAACGRPPGTCGSPPASCGRPPATCGRPPGTWGSPPATCGKPPATCGSPPAICGIPTPRSFPVCRLLSMAWLSSCRRGSHAQLEDSGLHIFWSTERGMDYLTCINTVYKKSISNYLILPVL